MFTSRDLALSFIVMGAFCIVTPTGYADDQPFLVAKSRSPDGKIELWMKPIESEGMAAGTTQIREVNTGKITSTFDWSGFGVRLIAPDPPFEVFWRGDSRYFAITYEESRGWRTGAIYGRNGKGDWVQIKMPNNEYRSAIEKIGGITDFYGKGCDAPKQWLKNGNLQLLFVDRALSYDHEDLEKEFMVELKVAGVDGEPLNTAKIASIKLQSKADTEKELQARFHSKK